MKINRPEQLNLPGTPKPAEQVDLPLKSSPDYFDFPEDERRSLAKSIRKKRAALGDGKTGVTFTPRELAFINADREHFKETFN